MDLSAAGLREQAFRTHGKQVTHVQYAAEQAAMAALEDMLDCRHALVLLQGPPLSGKTSILRAFLNTHREHGEAAVVNGQGLNTAALLEGMLRQFGYQLDTSSTAELLAMVRVFCLQQTTSHRSPILVIENAQDLNPSALNALCELAAMHVRGIAALKIVLVGTRPLAAMLEGESRTNLKKRLSKDHHLRPMSSDETRHYVHTKLKAAGSEAPDELFPRAICEEIWQASGGWPGIVDRLALLAIARSTTLPVSIDKIERPVLPQGTWLTSKSSGKQKAKKKEPPRVIVSSGGKTLKEIVFDRPRLLLGRSAHNDIAIDSKFISRHHALLVRYGSTTFMMDLNSTNGSFVNSKRVSNHVLIDGDILSIGHHRLKYVDPYATSREAAEDVNIADTAVMKTLDDMRTLLARENTALLPAATSEQLPTYVPGSG